jgi:hypothetical protein
MDTLRPQRDGLSRLPSTVSVKRLQMRLDAPTRLENRPPDYVV